MSNSSCFLSPLTDQKRTSNSRYTNTVFEFSPDYPDSLSASRLCETTIINSRICNSLSLLSNSSLTENNNENLSPLSTSSVPTSLPFNSLKQQTTEPTKSVTDSKKLTEASQSSQHIKKMKVIQSSSSSLSDFISPTPKSLVKNTREYRNKCFYV